MNVGLIGPEGMLEVLLVEGPREPISYNIREEQKSYTETSATFGDRKRKLVPLEFVVQLSSEHELNDVRVWLATTTAVQMAEYTRGVKWARLWGEPRRIGPIYRVGIRCAPSTAYWTNAAGENFVL